MMMGVATLLAPLIPRVSVSLVSVVVNSRLVEGGVVLLLPLGWLFIGASVLPLPLVVMGWFGPSLSVVVGWFGLTVVVGLSSSVVVGWFGLSSSVVIGWFGLSVVEGWFGLSVVEGWFGASVTSDIAPAIVKTL